MNQQIISTPFLVICNDGQRITSTDFWASEHAQQGFLYLSGNAGALRLMVPEASEAYLNEMRTGRSVKIEDSLRFPGKCYDIIFVDVNRPGFRGGRLV